ncbi:family 20 glycosylhydrolase [Pseudarthrobacter sp. J1738]|uniref:family 20 glycosylhydrolase n=1 Tax=Pseudarthrobacter sp. J1738 TaxID=3420446 RepID=UPI003D2BB1AF
MSVQLTPVPLAATPLNGTVVLDSATRIEFVQDAQGAAEFLAEYLRRGTRWPVPATADNKQSSGPVIRFVVSEPVADGSAPNNAMLDAGTTATLFAHEESYQLRVEGTEILVAATTAAGWFWAVQSLRQLLPATLETAVALGEPTAGETPARKKTAAQSMAAVTINAVEILDAPRFAYRGIMLDLARSFLTVPQIKHQLDVMASFKFNVLHLHLSDDQAWRIHINNPAPNPSGLDFEALSRVGGPGAVNTPGWGLSPGIGGFLTQDDYSEIVAYAAGLHIVVVPEIDVPGHVNAALAALPALNPDGVAKAMNTTGEVGYSTLDAQNPLTRVFVQEVFAQLAKITPGPYLHIGGDEAHVTSKEDYLSMVTDFAALGAESKTVIGWNEYAQAQLPEGSVIQFWHGDQTEVLRQINTNGAKLIMSPGAGSYLDQKYVSEDPIGLEWAAMGDWYAYYGWEPVLDGVAESSVLGIEAPLWSETVRGADQANWLIYPRAIAIAELAWSAESQRNAQDFAARLGGLGQRLVNLDVTFHPSPSISWNAQPRDPFANETSANREE